MKKKTVKKVFIFFLIFLPLQYAAVGIVGVAASEPWPAFVFPGFKSVYADSKVIKVERMHFFVKGQSGEKKIDTKTLFDGIKESQRLGFLKSNFSDSAEVASFQASTKNWLKERIENEYRDIESPRALIVRLKNEYYSNNEGRPVLDSTILQNTIRISF